MAGVCWWGGGLGALSLVRGRGWGDWQRMGPVMLVSEWSNEAFLHSIVPFGGLSHSKLSSKVTIFAVK